MSACLSELSGDLEIDLADIFTEEEVEPWKDLLDAGWDWMFYEG